jgi:hypothetical protein
MHATTAFSVVQRVPEKLSYETVPGLVMFDRRWFRPNLSAETEYSARATETESQNSAFLKKNPEKFEKR